MIDRVGSSERVDINFGFRESLTHAGKRAGTIRKKDRELRCRFDRELGIWVHGTFKVILGMTSDNSSKFNVDSGIISKPGSKCPRKHQQDVSPLVKYALECDCRFKHDQYC